MIARRARLVYASYFFIIYYDILYAILFIDHKKCSLQTFCYPKKRGLMQLPTSPFLFNLYPVPAVHQAHPIHIYRFSYADVRTPSINIQFVRLRNENHPLPTLLWHRIIYSINAAEPAFSCICHNFFFNSL